MDYLSEMCPIYSREVDGWVSEYEHDEVEWDEDNDLYYDIHTNHEVKHVRDRPAKWWCVAVYEIDRAYGGPEEGGWWYDCGNLVEHGRIKFFDRYQDAYDYTQELWAWCWNENRDRGDLRLAPRGFTEQMPNAYFPKKRPYYH